jgi:hypothetical protein
MPEEKENMLPPFMVASNRCKYFDFQSATKFFEKQWLQN